MLTIIVPGKETFDEEKSEFRKHGEFTLRLEHSLVSLSKWESKFEKPFLGDGEKTDEEVIGYIEAMLLDGDFPPEVFLSMTPENIDTINAYVNAKSSATFFTETIGSTKSREVITSELIYYWMVAFNIPFECENWHLNRLFTLIRICSLKNQKPKKQSRAEMLANRQRINAERKAMFGSSG